MVGIPLELEIYFNIDLLITKAISIPPYHMATTELKELKLRLKQLLVKGFIKPSISPMGALVLLMKKKDRYLRMGMNFRKLNKVIIKNNYPFPSIANFFINSNRKVFFKN